jgi:hypothetical protein
MLERLHRSAITATITIKFMVMVPAALNSGCYAPNIKIVFFIKMFLTLVTSKKAKVIQCLLFTACATVAYILLNFVAKFNRVRFGYKCAQVDASHDPRTPHTTHENRVLATLETFTP